MAPWIRATSPMRTSSRVARNEIFALFPASPEWGPAPVTTVPVTSTALARTTIAIAIRCTTRGTTTGAVAASGTPARHTSTNAFASRTAERRKWPITNGGSSSFFTTSAPSSACAITPSTRPSDSHTRSRRRGVRTSDPNTAMITAIDTIPVTMRLMNSILP